MIGLDAEPVPLDYGFFAFWAICGFGVGRLAAIAHVNVMQAGLTCDCLGFQENVLGRGRQVGQFVLGPRRITVSKSRPASCLYAEAAIRPENS